MAGRKVTTLVIERAGRDQGKTFQITEMSSVDGFKWAMRAFLAAAKAGVHIPDQIQGMGFAGIALLGIKAVCTMSWLDAEDLSDELMQCVKIIPDPNRPAVVRPLIPEDIEEIDTQFLLRKSVLTLHTDFFGSAASLISASIAVQPTAAESVAPTSPSL